MRRVATFDSRKGAIRRERNVSHVEIPKSGIAAINGDGSYVRIPKRAIAVIFNSQKGDCIHFEIREKEYESHLKIA